MDGIDLLIKNLVKLNQISSSNNNPLFAEFKWLVFWNFWYPSSSMTSGWILKNMLLFINCNFGIDGIDELDKKNGEGALMIS